MKPLKSLDKLAKSLGDLVPEFFVNLAARISIFMIFWTSVQLKLEGDSLFGQKWAFWELSPSTFMLFEHEYALPLLPVEFAAYLATLAEFFVSILLLIGMLTRFSALALILMTLVIQIFVYPDLWATHLLWLAPLLYLLKKGGGEVSIDRLLLNRT